jgi:hypothetical protein
MIPKKEMGAREMNSLFSTILIAFGVVLLAALAMALGWILKGRPLERGCGKKPGARHGECGEEEGSCAVCDPNYNEKQRGKNGNLSKRETRNDSTDV